MTERGLQPADDIPFTLSLTPKEIIGLAVKIHASMTSSESMLCDATVYAQFSNERTGWVCRLAAGEIPVEDPESDDFEQIYIVELETEHGVIHVAWFCDINDDAQRARLRKSAEQTLIAWSGLIGVQVGYGLVAAPPQF